MDSDLRTERFRDALRYGAETVATEFKAACEKRAVFGGIVQTALAFANTEEGGWIYVGVKERHDRTLEPTGLSEDQIASFQVRTLDESIASYGDPAIKCECFLIEDEIAGVKLKVLAIRVWPSTETVTICLKAFENGKPQPHAIYVRSESPIASARATAEQLRVLLERILDSKIAAYVHRQVRQGLLISPFPAVQSHLTVYDEELTRNIES